MEPTYPYPIYYVISRGVLNPQGIMIHHVLKVVETTLDRINDVYQREALPIIDQAQFNVYTMMIDRPANLDFLLKLAEAEKASAK